MAIAESHSTAVPSTSVPAGNIGKENRKKP